MRTGKKWMQSALWSWGEVGEVSTKQNKYVKYTVCLVMMGNVEDNNTGKGEWRGGSPS
jgi:hypothetical protein